MHTYLNAGYPHVFCVTLARETKVRGHEDKIDEPSVSTYPSWCADPCLEMVKSLPYFGLYVRVLSFFLTTTIPRQAHAKRAKTRFQSKAKEA